LTLLSGLIQASLRRRFCSFEIAFLGHPLPLRLFHRCAGSVAQGYAAKYQIFGSKRWRPLGIVVLAGSQDVARAMVLLLRLNHSIQVRGALDVLRLTAFGGHVIPTSQGFDDTDALPRRAADRIRPIATQPKPSLGLRLPFRRALLHAARAGFKPNNSSPQRTLPVA
jgi:hypothetical protein